MRGRARAIIYACIGVIGFREMGIDRCCDRIGWMNGEKDYIVGFAHPVPSYPHTITDLIDLIDQLSVRVAFGVLLVLLVFLLAAGLFFFLIVVTKGLLVARVGRLGLLSLAS